LQTGLLDRTMLKIILYFIFILQTLAESMIEKVVC
jgi:hypothetical protein